MDNGASNNDSSNGRNFCVCGRDQVIGSGIQGDVRCDNFGPERMGDIDE